MRGLLLSSPGKLACLYEFRSENKLSRPTNGLGNVWAAAKLPADSL